MSAARTAAAPSSLPDPPPDRPVTDAPAPTRAGRILGVLRKLVAYGKDLAASLQQCVSPRSEHVVRITRDFGIADIGLILASITRALLRAAALEAKVTSRGVPPDDAPVRVRAPRQRRPRPRPPAEPSDQDPRIVRMPTPEEIAAQIRRRPAGAVLADICFDLGLRMGHPLWPGLRSVIDENGGDSVRLMLAIFRRDHQSMKHGRTGVWAPTEAELALERSAIAPPAPLAAASGAGPP